MLGVFAPFSRGRKNPLACDGHPVGEEIDFAGFVCSRPIGVMHCLVIFFISLHFSLIVLLVYYKYCMAVMTLQLFQNSFI